MKELINLYNTCPICGKQYTGHPALSRTRRCHDSIIRR